ncbi:prephenate dehydrogenase/arogenate dehydrogenase family protein [bacterium]|nr:prephenate dehydrogenase/arogenate dehydrogenase family protein [bacterium]
MKTLGVKFGESQMPGRQTTRPFERSVPMDLEQLNLLRTQIADLDAKIVELVGKRLSLADKVGQFKIDNGMTIKAFDVEKKVMERYEALAKKFGIDFELSKDLSKLLIDHACRVQEKKRFTSITQSYKDDNSPGKALIIGGSGNMGRWFCNFLSSFGYNIVVSDQNTSDDTLTYLGENETLSEVAQNVDLIVISTPLAATAKVIEEVAQTNSKALIFDVASLKSPIIETLNKAKKSLPNLVSIHPMFGPDVDLLTGENILICDLGNQQATQKAYKLFEQTAATVTVTSPEGHDELMGEVLGLSHILNLLFGQTLSKSKLPKDLVVSSKSTTFKNQLEVAKKVAGENPALYFDIQRLNAFTPELYERIRTSFEELTSLVLLDEKENFTQAMMNISKTCDQLD